MSVRYLDCQDLAKRTIYVREYFRTYSGCYNTVELLEYDLIYCLM